MFSLETYDRVRRRMDSASIFPTIDEKAPLLGLASESKAISVLQVKVG